MTPGRDDPTASIARATEATMRSPRGIALGVLMPTALALLPLIPAVRAVLGVDFPTMAAAMGWFIASFLLSARVLARHPPGTRMFAIWDRVETVLVQAPIAFLIVASGRGDTFFWMLWLFHVVILAQCASWPRFHAGVLAGTVLVIAGAFLVVHAHLEAAVLALCVGGLGLYVYWLGLSVAHRLAAADAERARLAGELAAVRVREERERIAREIHDGVGADLAALDWRLRSLRAPAGDRELAAELDELIGRLARGADDLRGIVWALRTPARRWDELVAYLRQRTLELCGDHLAGEVLDAGDGGVAHHAGELALDYLRAVLELVRNATRHARATRIHVTLAATPTALRAIVEDDGRGLPPAALDRQEGGLANLRARLARAGGSIAIEPRPGGGSRIAIEFPDPGLAAAPA